MSRVSLLLDWFEDEFESQQRKDLKQALAELFRLQGIQIKTGDVHFLRRTPGEPEARKLDYPGTWSHFCESLARGVDQLLLNEDGKSCLIVMSSEMSPLVPLPNGSRDLGSQVHRPLGPDRFEEGLYWYYAGSTDTHWWHAGRQAVANELALYWAGRLVQAWSGLGHGQSNDIVNEGLGCVAALAREIRGDKGLSKPASEKLLSSLALALPGYRAALCWHNCVRALSIRHVYGVANVLADKPESASQLLRGRLQSLLQPEVEMPETWQEPADPAALARIISSIYARFHNPSARDYNWGELADEIMRLFLISAWVRKVARLNGWPIRSDSDAGRSRSKPASLVPKVAERRILVVDDTPEPWMPLLEIMADELPARIDFSTDAENVLLDETEVPIASRLHWYDVVLTDIRFTDDGDLPQNRDPFKGLELAHQIKRNHPRLPVVVWSSSDDRDVLAGMRLADAFVVKKTLGLSTGDRPFLNLLRSLSDRRIAQRSVQLLDPGFDEAIWDVGLRATAQCVADAAMDLLDSFHALDDSYFKFFNDHGTKHSIRVAANLVRLFESLFPHHIATQVEQVSAGAYPPLWTDDGQLTEWSISLLYAASFAHDLGMFHGVGVGSSPDSYGADPKHAMKERRSLHPFLSALWLQEHAERLVQGQPTTEIARSLIDDLGVVCAAHHSGVAVEFSMNWSAAAAGLKALDGNTALGKRFRQGILEITSYTKDTARIADLIRLGKMLALADAFDCDMHRVPPEFIRQHPRVNPKDHDEYVKRLVIQSVEVKAGTLRLSTWASIPDWQSEDEERVLNPSEYRLGQEKLLSDISKQYWTHPTSVRAEQLATAGLKLARLDLIEEFEQLRRSFEPVNERLALWEFGRSEIEFASTRKPAEYELPSIRYQRVHQPKLSIKPGEMIDDADIYLLGLLIPENYRTRYMVRGLTPGYSGSRVYLFTGVDGALQPKVAKVSDAESVLRELQGYTHYAVHHLPVESLIGHVEYRELRGRAAYIGALAGGKLGESDDLRSIYRTHPGMVEAALRRVFQEVMLCSRIPSSERLVDDMDLAREWQGRFHKARSTFEMVQETGRGRYPADFSARLLNMQMELLDGSRDQRLPKWFARFLEPCYLSIVHADLNWRNIIVRHDGQSLQAVYLIDFADMGPWLRLADFAKIETDLLLSVDPPSVAEVQNTIKSTCVFPGFAAGESSRERMVASLREICSTVHANLSTELLPPALLHYYMCCISYPPESDVSGKWEQPQVTLARTSLALGMIEELTRVMKE